jgi:hypothetical protein
MSIVNSRLTDNMYYYTQVKGEWVLSESYTDDTDNLHFCKNCQKQIDREETIFRMGAAEDFFWCDPPSNT